MIIGLNGDIESGKTTFADFLAEQLQPSGHWESWQVIAEVARHLRSSGIAYPLSVDLGAINAWLEPLPGAVEQVARRSISEEDVMLTTARVKDHPADYVKLFEHLDLVHDNPGLQTTEIKAANKETFRPLLQWLGGFLIKQTDDGLWYDEILRRISAHPELALTTIGGVRYPGESKRIQTADGKVLRMVRPTLEKRDAADLTELQGSQVPVNATIINDGSLAQLKQCAAQVLKDLKIQKLAESYQASSF